MIKTYKSRISVILVLVIALVCFSPLLIVPFDKFVGLCVVDVLTFISAMAVMTGFKYVIDGQTLRIYSLYVFHLDIDIKSITKMEPNHNILSAPAASLSRLAIHYGKYDMVNISPRNQEDFVRQINEIIGR